MKKARRILALLGLLVLATTACGPLMGTPEQGEAPLDELPADVETAVKEALGATTGAEIDEIEIVAVTETEWPDACLGLGEEDEVCAQVITPGYEIRVRAGGQEYVIRTDLQGDVVRIEE